MIARRVSWCALLGVLAACERAPMMRPAAGPEPESGPGGTAAPAGDVTERLLRATATAASEAGAGAVEVLGNDFAAEGDRVGAFIDPPADECLLLMARGSDGVDDIDLLTFSDDGTPLAVDEGQDATPTVMLCPPQGGRVYAMARVITGRGRVALGSQRVPRAAAERVGRATNARGRPGGGHREAEGWAGLEGHTSALERLVGGRWRPTRKAALAAEARSPGLVSEPLAAGRCLLILVTPSDDTSEMDVQVLDADGRVMGRGSEIGRDRGAVVCSTLPTKVGVEVRPRIGAGVAAVVMSTSVPGSEGDINGRIERLDAFAEGDASAALGRIGARLSAAGYGAPSARARGEARSGQRATTTLALPAGCTRLDVAAGAPPAGLVAETWSEQGHALGRVEAGAQGALFVCGAGGKVRLEVEATQRPGPFGVEVRGEPVDGALRSLAGGRLLGRLNAVGEVVRAGQLGDIRKLAVEAQRTASASLLAPVGKCVEVAVGLDDGSSGVELSLSDAQGDGVARGAGSWATATRVCAPAGAPRPLTMQVRVASGKGDAVMATRVVASQP